MDSAKGSAVAGLYDEVMVEILSRVPVKDLRRTTCVSKPWRDLITDPLNRKKLPQTLEGFFHGGTGGRRTYGHFASLSRSAECVPPVDPSFSFLTAKLPGVERMALMDSCNGLLLFGCTREGELGYIVCNPATEELVTLPASSGSCPPPLPFEQIFDGERYSHTFLMFDPAVSFHFHLIQIWEDRSVKEVETVHSYSSETRAWSDRSSKWNRGEKGGEWELWGEAMIKFSSGRALVNGLLHFVIIHVQKQEDQIVAVDGEGKTCRIITWPWSGKGAEIIAFIGESKDHLHCIGVNLKAQGSHWHLTGLSVWVLEDYETQEWILKHNVSSSQFLGSLNRPFKDIMFVGIHPDHNLIILVQRWNQKLVLYNMNNEELHVIHTLGEGYPLFTPYAPCFMESSVLATKG